MIYGSVCSGIEAASVAWEPLGWQPSWFAEIESFPSAVLAHHWPHGVGTCDADDNQGQAGHLIPVATSTWPVSHCLNAGGMGRIDYETETMVVHGTQDPDTNTELAHTLGRNNGGENACLVPDMAVRRLTPIECERLQGFPDGHTDVPYRDKVAADGPRYKAIGNSMAVPCMAWIGRRIADHVAASQKEAAV